MNEIVQAMVRVAGVTFQCNAEVKAIREKNGKAVGVTLADGTDIDAHAVLGTGDYHHPEQRLLPEMAPVRRSLLGQPTMSPSSLLYYVGLDTRVPELQHHNLFFDTPFGPHANTIYDTNTWPDDPLFYVCAPSRTDPSVAGRLREPVLRSSGPGPDEEGTERDRYFEEIMERLERHTEGTFGPMSSTSGPSPTENLSRSTQLQRQRLRLGQHASPNGVLEAQNAEQTPRLALRRPIDHAWPRRPTQPHFWGSGGAGNFPVPACPRRAASSLRQSGLVH